LIKCRKERVDRSQGEIKTADGDIRRRGGEVKFGEVSEDLEKGYSYACREYVLTHQLF